MSDYTNDEFFLIALLGIVMLAAVFYFRSRSGQSPRQILFGSRFGQGEGSGVGIMRRKRRAENGTRNELTSLAGHLVRFASMNGMRLIAPAAIVHEGQMARTTALLVAPGGILGIYCLGFGGTVTPKIGAAEWAQQINGEDRSFRNPLASCKEQRRLIQSAMDSLGLAGDVRVVAVFTNPHVTLTSVPADVYPVKDFMKYLAQEESLRKGTIDVMKTAEALTALVPIDELRAAAKRRDSGG
ncbi:MAG: hypothetical protein LUE86_12345 [Clostridiales bacterium]|nr:hypothetical protein [Clostridiales bacterium]